MTAGALRHRVMFERKADAPDRDFSEVVHPWVLIFLAWADIKPVSSGDVTTDEDEDRIRRVNIRIRYDQRFTGDMRVRWGTRVFNITGYVNQDERDRYILIDAVELEGWQVA